MSKKDDGGTAFPHEYRDGDVLIECPGMTLRDWFAAQALPTCLINFGYDQAAGMAYQVADAMLAERAK